MKVYEDEFHIIWSTRTEAVDYVKANKGKCCGPFKKRNSHFINKHQDEKKIIQERSSVI